MRHAAALLLALPIALQAQSVPASRVDSVFARWASTTSPGCAVGVARDGRPVLARAYGMANLEYDVANTSETVFEAGSVSKQVTAAAVILLAQRGALSLDDPVRRWVPELPDYGAPITLRHLLNHTSGLRDWGSVVAVAGWPRTTRVHTNAHALDVMRRQRALNFAPGAEYSYSNSGYNLLAIIVERASGRSLAEFSKRELFAPLGMTRTEWRDDFTRVVKARATAYARRDSAWRQLMPFENVYGNGGLLTTVGDLLIWNRNLDAPTVGGAALVTEMQRRGRLTSGREIEYASGLFVTRYRGVPEVSHSGATAGYRAFLARYPEQKLSVAVLCNAASANATALAHGTADVFLGDALAPRAVVRAVPLSEAQLAAPVGLYRDPRSSESAELRLDDGRLRFDGAELVPLSPTTFALPTQDARARLEVDGAGRARRLWQLWGPDSVGFERVERARPTAAQLAELAGAYASDEVETTISVAVEGDSLVLHRRPAERTALVPLYADAFALPGAGVIRFSRDSAGRVDGSWLSVGRARNLRFVRVKG